ncbi:MAG: cob(I)yrinic acid a,c-diamide adenosyltransferase [Lentisphaerae bacterium]|nr:cob(I)yrinic acid a,c-diamide adenosyltransferase [Lentisphaerota bacterium]
MKGRIQVYTGDGKGKTSAALGLIVRAAGAGLRVYLGQFCKRGDSPEIRVLRERFPEATAAAFGCGGFIRNAPSEADIRAARAGLAALRAALTGGAYDVVIADEAGPAVKAGVIAESDLADLAACRPDAVELVFTGRDMPASIIARADLVTEMKAVRHYFDRGVPARPGIER